MNTILYRCTDLEKAGFTEGNLSFIIEPCNQFMLDTVPLFEDGHKTLAFVDIFSIQQKDFDELHKCLLVDDIQYDSYGSYGWRSYDEFKQYFEPICDLAEYQLVTKEESTLYEQDNILPLRLAHGDILYFVKSQEKQSLCRGFLFVKSRQTWYDFITHQSF